MGVLELLAVGFGYAARSATTNSRNKYRGGEGTGELLEYDACVPVLWHTSREQLDQLYS